MTDLLAEALDLIEHHVIPPEERAHLLILADIAQSLRPHAAMFTSEASQPTEADIRESIADEAEDRAETICDQDVISGDDGTGWPARKGWSRSGYTWLCDEPGCGFGVTGLSHDGPFKLIRDHVDEHIRERIRERIRETAEDGAE